MSVPLPRKPHTLLSLVCSILLANGASAQQQKQDRPQPPVVLAIENGDLETFKKLVSKETLFTKERTGIPLRMFSGVEEADIMRGTAISGKWKMLDHLFSQGAPAYHDAIADFVVKMPNGGKIVDSFIDNYPGAKKGSAGTEFLCALIARFEISGADKPHPYVTKLVEAGVPLESKNFSALITAVEVRDLVLINYLKSKGAKIHVTDRWHLHSFTAKQALGDMKFNAMMLAGMSRNVSALKLLPPLNDFGKKMIADFEKEYPPQPDSPLLGTWEVIDEGEEPVAIYPYFRLLADRTARFPEAGIFDAAAWTKEGKEITLQAIGANGPDDKFPTVLQLTDKAGELRVIKLHGRELADGAVRAIRLGGLDKKEFSVPKDSPAIGKWKGKVVNEGSPEIELSLELTADAKGVMRVNTGGGGGATIKMEVVWKHDTAKREVVLFVIKGGKVQRGNAMHLKLSKKGDKMVADDDGATQFSKVE